MFSWNYHEAGHGKGAPDGVGATCKRTADQVIAQKGDIMNLHKIADTLHKKCPAIKISIIEDVDIKTMDDLINANQNKQIPFQETLKVHQICGNVQHPNRLIMKSLSCFCDPITCEHYKLGTIKFEQDQNLSGRRSTLTAHSLKKKKSM